MLYYNGDVDKPQGKRNKGSSFCFLSSLHLIGASFVSTSLLINTCTGKKAYALRGSPGSGRSSVEFEALWTGLKWHCLVPGKKMESWSQKCLEFERNCEVS